MIVKVKNRDELEAVKADAAAAIFFHSHNCNVCNALFPTLGEVIVNNFPEIHLYIVNADELKELCAYYTVLSFSTVLIYFEGKESIRASRNINTASLMKEIDRPYRLLFD